MPFVYLVRCADRFIKGGWTSDVEPRVAMHNDGRAGTYTRGRRPVTLVFTEAHTTVASAISRERQIKHWSSAKKAVLVAGNSAALKRFAISHASPRSAGLKLAGNTCQKPEANDGNDDWDFHE